MIGASLLASILLVTSPAGDWFRFGSGPDRGYEISESSIKVDLATKSIQFLLKTTFTTERISEGRSFSYITEPVILLCDKDVLITVSQTGYDKNDKQVITSNVSNIYPVGQRGQVVTEILRFGCGTLENGIPKSSKPAVMI